MTTEEKLALLRERFIHRDDTYVEQFRRIDKEGKARYGYVPVVTGDCEYRCPTRVCPHVQRRPLTDSSLIEHLKGQRTIGIYQIKQEENTVRWLCFDIDADTQEGEASIPTVTKTIAYRLYRLIGQSYLVEWSGNKGYHVWVFFSDALSAGKVMAFGHFILSQVEIPEGVHVEVFPKQPTVRAYGNLVKLPLGIHRKTGNRCLFVNNKFESYPLEEQWSLLQNVTTLNEQEFDELLDLYNIEEIQAREPTIIEGGYGPSTLPCMARLMQEGAVEGSRDICTFKLACYLRDRGLPENLAKTALEAWNEQNSPPFDERELDVKLDSAYAGRYSPFPCGERAFDAYCSSSCRLWDNKVASRGLKSSQEAVGKISRD